MEVHFDLPEALAGEVGEGVQRVWAVLLAREKERVSRPVTVGVAIAIDEARIPLVPSPDARGAPLLIRAAPQRLVVIAEREDEMPGTVVGSSERSPCGVTSPA
jgi:hypothetical protein